MQLRWYQDQAVSDLRLAIRAVQSALLVMPTGAGKTVVFTEIAQLAKTNGKKVLILVHRRELVAQASAKLKKIGVKHEQYPQAASHHSTGCKSRRSKPLSAGSIPTTGGRTS